MKRHLILLLLIGISVGFGSAFAHDYAPEGVGSTWTYKVGTETVNASIASPGNWLVGEDSNFFIIVDGALYSTGVAWPGGGRNYNPYIKSLPASPSIGIVQEEQITVSRYSGSLTWEDTWDVRIEIVAIENVSVPAGNFSNCLKIEEYQRRNNTYNNTITTSTDYLWYAKNVGIVKFIDDGVEYQLTSYNIATVGITEIEPNNTLSSAQDINDYFTLGNNVNIENSTTVPWVSINATGDGSFDYYKFYSPGSGGQTRFDIDYGYQEGDPGSFDSMTALWKLDGTYLYCDRSSDPSTGAGGSSSGNDSLLGYTITEPGWYVIGVATDKFGCITSNGGFDSSVKPVPSGATYVLQVSIPDNETKITINSIQESTDVFPPTLSISGNYSYNGQPQTNTWIGGDDPIGQECNEKFIQTDSNGIFTKTWDTTNVKPGIYQVVLYTDGAETQISIPITNGINLNSPNTFQSEVFVDYGQLNIAGQYYNPMTLSCSTISGDCKILKPTIDRVFDDLKGFATFFYYGIGFTSVSIIEDPLTYVGKIMWISCGPTMGITCPVAAGFDAVATIKSGIVGFARAAIHLSDLNEEQRFKAYLIISSVDNIIYYGVNIPGYGFKETVDDATEWTLLDSKSHVEFYYDNQLTSNSEDQSEREPKGVYIVAKRTDGTVAVIAISNKAKPRAMPWIPLLLLDD